MNVEWPSNHKFAFTIFDDTDWASLGSVKPVYDLLSDLELRATKSVWMFESEEPTANGGATCEDPAYVQWLLQLQRRGFEIALHNAAPGTSSRERVRFALQRFHELFGKEPFIHCNHQDCLENIYWGSARLSGWRRPLYDVLTKGQKRGVSRGHIKGDPLFWGDLCQKYISYVRNFVFNDLNTLAICPEMPYHDPQKPFVNFWFASADGGNRVRFLRNFTIDTIDALVAAGGLCIAYVHFAGGFAKDGAPDPEFRRRLEYLAAQDGWFAPVSVVLDFLRKGGGREERRISAAGLRRLETRWLVGRVRKALTLARS